MKKFIILIAMALAMASCTKNKSEVFPEIPAPADVVMYQINPRNFAEKNAFIAIKNHVAEIKELGVNVVWFMPICEIGVEKAVKSPYCVKDYTAVNPEFGTMDDFKSLVEDFHDRGICVIIDWVANHTSWDNKWIEDHPDWYTTDETGEIIFPEGTGWRDVADLNFDNADMRQAMIDAMKFWVEETGVDGFRCDAADYVPFDFWEDCVSQLRAIPDRTLLLLAEGQRKDHFTAGFDMNYAWQWLSALRRVYNGAQVRLDNPDEGERRRPARTVTRQVPASSLFSADSSEYAGIPEGRVKLRFITNHDENAKMSPIREFFGEDGSMAAFVATAFIHGGVLIYDCQVVGYPGKIQFFNYAKVDWNSHRELREEYTKLIEIYKSNSCLRSGDLVPYPDDNVLMFERKDKAGVVLVLANLRDSQQYISIPENLRNQEYVNLMTGNRAPLTDSELLLMPFEYLVLKLS